MDKRDEAVKADPEGLFSDACDHPTEKGQLQRKGFSK